MIEFVSVNPTGPLHVGHARGAILGSALANILTKTGHAVWCEYYVNDAGTQNRIFQEAMYNLIHPKTREQRGPSLHGPTETPLSHDGPTRSPTEYEQEITDLTRKIEADSYDVWTYNRRGIAYMTKPDPDYDRAISDFTIATERHHGFAEPYDNRGIAYTKKPDPNYEQAISDFDRAIDIHENALSIGREKLPSDAVSAYHNRGLAYMTKSNPNYEQAISDFNYVINVLEDSLKNGGKSSNLLATTYHNRGSAYFNKPNPNYDQALSDYNQALKLDSGDPSRTAVIHTNRGNANIKSLNPDFDQAISDYTRAIELNPSYSEAYANRGAVYAYMPTPDYDRAILDYCKAIELDPNNALAYANRGNAYAYMPTPDYGQALSNYNEAINLDPNNALVYADRGGAYAYMPNPDYDRAISDYSQAISLDPNNALVYANRGDVYLMKPNPDYRFAISDFTEALKIEPHNTAIYEARAAAYEKSGEIDLARDDRAMAKLNSESYTGEYMNDLKEKWLKKRPYLEELSRAEFMKRTERTLVGRVVLDIKKTLDNLGVSYDQWFYESELMGEDGAWVRMFNELKQKGYIEERDDAQWFLATKFGAEKDVVVVRSGKRKFHSYFATDFAYHLNKLGPKPPYRNFSRTINIWGGDHHGHVIRLAAAMQAVDIDPSRVQVQTVQIVHFKVDDKKLKLSKRKGQIVTIDDLLDEVRKDACRYEFLNRSHNAQMTFDIEQAKRQTLENPVYYIQYAHARLFSVMERGMVLEGWERSAEFDLNLLEHPNERELMLT